MAAFTGGDKTLAAQQELTHPDLFLGAPVEVNSFLAGKWYLWHANIQTDANIDGVRYYIQASRLTSGNRDWVNIATILTGKTAALLANMTATEPIGEKTLAVTAGEEVGFVPGALIFVRDNSVVADSEWHYVDDIPTNQITIWDGLAVQKDSADDIFSESEEFFVHLDLAGIFRIRMAALHRSASGANIAFKSFLRNAEKIENQ